MGMVQKFAAVGGIGFATATFFNAAAWSAAGSNPSHDTAQGMGIGATDLLLGGGLTALALVLGSAACGAHVLRHRSVAEGVANVTAGTAGLALGTVAGVAYGVPVMHYSRPTPPASNGAP